MTVRAIAFATLIALTPLAHALKAGFVYQAAHVFNPEPGQRVSKVDKTDPKFYAEGYELAELKVCDGDSSREGGVIYKATAKRPGPGNDPLLFISHVRSEGSRMMTVSASFHKTLAGAISANDYCTPK